HPAVGSGVQPWYRIKSHPSRILWGSSLTHRTPNRGFRNVPQGLQVSNEPFIRQGYCGSSVHKHVAPHSPYGAFHNRGLDLRGPYDDDR
ncbi:hypothetical protein T03_8368, partial [Trichinella britovi]